MEANRRGPIGIELVRRGLISQADINKALDYQRRHPEKKIVEIIRTLNLCNEYVLLETLGEILNEKAIMLTQSDVQININQYISLDVANKYKVVPFQINGNKIKVCFSDTLNKEAVDTVKLILLNKGLTMEKYISFEKNVMDVLKNFEGNSIENIESSGDATTLVDSIIRTAMKKRASDIHIEALEEKVRVRYRIDGALYEKMVYDNSLLPAIATRIKIMGGMDISEKRKPQDGRMSIEVDRQEYDIRISSIPTVHGEKLVLRLSSKLNLTRSKKELGLSDAEMGIFDHMLAHPYGIIFVTGPTGSGKSTTLYTALSELNTENVNIVTVEDPVEADIEGINQIQVNPKVNLTFASALRSILRQDPDIIMIGEIRDRETASIAVQASITGHLVVSTMHTNNAVGTLNRMADMGVESYLIADSMVGVIAQRLVRKLCPHCKKPHMATAEEKKLLRLPPDKEKEIYEPGGCHFCNQTGYFGRIGVFEMMEVNDDMRKLISANASTEKLTEAARRTGMHTLRENAVQYVLDGVTSVEEMLRASYE